MTSHQFRGARRPLAAIRAAASFTALLALPISAATAESFIYTGLDVPGQTQNKAFALNDNDQVAGAYTWIGQTSSQGFIWTANEFTVVPKTVEFTAINDKGVAAGTITTLPERNYAIYDFARVKLTIYRVNFTGKDILPTAINAANLVIGQAIQAPGKGPVPVAGYLFDRATATLLAPPGYNGCSYPGAISSSGAIVGSYGGSSECFMYASGQYTQFTPLANAEQCGASFITDSGVIGGVYETQGDNRLHGYTLAGGVATTYDYPVGETTGLVGTGPDGELVGNFMHYRDGSNMSSGFVYVKGHYHQIVAPGQDNTVLIGVNTKGSLLGYYLAAGVAHYFIAQCATGKTCIK